MKQDTTTFGGVRRTAHSRSQNLRRFGIAGKPEATRRGLRVGLLGDVSGRFGGHGYGYGHGGVGVIGLMPIVIVVLMLRGRI
jgi:hypothetical protein